MPRSDTAPQHPPLRTLDEVDVEYSAAVVDHWLHPRHRGALKRPDGHARITGRCGETMEIWVRLADETVAEASYLADGCVVSVAAASMAVELALGAKLVDARSISREDIASALGGLPDDHRHCAALAAATLAEAMDDALIVRGGLRPRRQASRSKRSPA